MKHLVSVPVTGSNERILPSWDVLVALHRASARGVWVLLEVSRHLIESCFLSFLIFLA
jgi:hypothetical protein